MKFYAIYDNLYEEYMTPILPMKNDNIAISEFNIFKENLIKQAKDEKEKQRIKTRYYICKYGRIRFDKESGNIITDEKTFQPEILTAPGDEEE